MRLIFWIFIIFCFCLMVVASVFLFLKQSQGTKFLTGCFAEHCFSLEVADNPQKQSQGLMFRNGLPEDEGMLFVFPEMGIYNFWMKDTLIALDIIWLNQNKEVVFIKENAQPCQENDCPKIEPGVIARYVLEIKGGRAEEIGLKIGDKFSFEF